MKDIIIIGAGVVGSAIARELSKYKLDIVTLEKRNEIANEASKANTAIVHSGYDPEPGTLMAKLNVEGNAMYDQLHEELDFPFIRNGSLILAFNEKEKKTLEDLLERGVKNGVPNLKILDRDELLKMEPNLSDNVYAGLYAPTGGIVSPWQLPENLAEVAQDNGVAFHLSEEVVGITKQDDVFSVQTTKSSYQAKIVINCAGVHADDIHNLICEKDFTIQAVKGQYLVYPHCEGAKITATMFRLPDERGKGVLVTPTAHGHLLVGPTSEDVAKDNQRETTPHTFEYLQERAEESVKNIDYKQSIRQYAGVRANPDTEEFIIREDAVVKGFIDVSGIKSPGLSSAPAIAVMVADIVKKTERLTLPPNPNFNPKRRKQKVLYACLEGERNAVIKADKNFGDFVDRHEFITAGDILDIVNRNAGAHTLNGVKRRTRCGASESQMIFTMPKVITLLSETMGVDPAEILLEDDGSYVLTKKARLDNKAIRFAYEKYDFNALADRYETVIAGAGVDGLKEAAKRADKGEEVLVVDLLDEIGGAVYEMLSFETALRAVSLDAVNALVHPKVKYLLNTAVFSVDAERNMLDVVSTKGYKQIEYKNLVLALGSYEANRETLLIPGTRPSGIFTAMQAIRILNDNKYLFGEQVLCYGSSSELALLRERLEKEGAAVQTLEKGDVITEIKGYPRLSSVIVNGNTEVACDTLVVSQGYIPDNVLTKKIGLKLNKDDFVLVDGENRSSINNIYAVGTISAKQ